MDAEDTWLAFQVDLACLMLGRQVERLTRPGPKGEPGWTVERALTEGDGRAVVPDRGFRDPTPYVQRKMHIPESGIW